MFHTGYFRCANICLLVGASEFLFSLGQQQKHFSYWYQVGGSGGGKPCLWLVAS